MNKLGVLVIAVALLACNKGPDSPIELDPDWRYFRFSGCEQDAHGNWQDTSFVAATANAAVIEQCLAQLELSEGERSLFPLGLLAKGYGGYNTNHTHRFNWHLVEDDWELVEVGIEIYDGCPYSDAQLTNYRGNVGRYGGWSNRVMEEVFIGVVTPL